MDNSITSYTHDEAEKEFGVQYCVVRENKRKVIDIESPLYRVETIIKNSNGHENNEDKIFDDEESAVEHALHLSNKTVFHEYVSAKQWRRSLNNYAITSLGVFFLQSKYRKERQLTDKFIKGFEQKSDENNKALFKKEDIVVNKNKTFNIFKPYSGKAYYLNIGYEHNNKLPQYAQINLFFNRYDLVDGIYYHNYRISSIDGNMSDENMSVIDSFGFSYGYDSNFNGHKNAEGVLFTFDKRSKIYSSKEALKKDINKAIEATIERLESFSQIDTQL